MSFYENPAEASVTLASRVRLQAILMGRVQVRRWRGRVHISGSMRWRGGWLIGIYDRRAILADIREDILHALK